jgi:hypothetical protein
VNTEHPIKPPQELLENLEQLWFQEGISVADLLTKSYQAGADQELEALLVWLRVKGFDNLASDLLAARRPKPPSLKEQALALVEQHEEGWRPSPKDWDTIRRALEALDD